MDTLSIAVSGAELAVDYGLDRYRQTVVMEWSAIGTDYIATNDDIEWFVSVAPLIPPTRSIFK